MLGLKVAFLEEIVRRKTQKRTRLTYMKIPELMTNVKGQHRKVRRKLDQMEPSFCWQENIGKGGEES